MRQPTTFDCDITGISAHATPIEGIDDLDLPVGWIEVTIRKIVKNPEYEEANVVYEAARAQALETQAQEIGDDENKRAIAEAMIDRMLPAPDLDEYEVDERVYHVCGEQEAIILAPFGDADGLEA